MTTFDGSSALEIGPGLLVKAEIDTEWPHEIVRKDRLFFSPPVTSDKI